MKFYFWDINTNASHKSLDGDLIGDFFVDSLILFVTRVISETDICTTQKNLPQFVVNLKYRDFIRCAM